jgi:flagellar basal body rod protein FlgC
MKKYKPWQYALIVVGIIIFLLSDLLVDQYYTLTKSSVEATVISNEVTASTHRRGQITKYVQKVRVSFTDEKGTVVERTEQGYKNSTVLKEGQKIKVNYEPNNPNWVRIAR